jgi:hypothetical protein
MHFGRKISSDDAENTGRKGEEMIAVIGVIAVFIFYVTVIAD